ncbi:MAG: phospho-N-acetylmuramoyl-pentapeptide-transferase, partial [Clostridiales bacterium]|nr:phospho-N-acetylmuramoyl-pentapeptide-transferase [Clostridiales bacterium]
FFLFVAWAVGSPVLPLAGAAVGSLLGFLLFNSYPARVFMGDTGSLALGGFVAAISILLKMPLFILIVALVYLIEVISVIIQVAYFKMTRRRFFKMAPIHHSFELSGWPETKIVTLFYVVTAILCLIGYLGGKPFI